MTESEFPNQMPVDLVMAYAAKRSGALENTKNTPFQKDLVAMLLEIASEDREWAKEIYRELYGEDIDTAIQRERGEQSIPAETDVT